MHYADGPTAAAGAFSFSAQCARRRQVVRPRRLGAETLLPNVVMPATRANFGREWARLDSNQGPTDYESAALTN